ncbi:response regulator [Paucibacter sp. AS339]|uniref:hybrid sensor histidine kinase/response regulator n=1 Tax=Paucibacter hankyongi TaxID=3133434 RepID=UPI0030A72162
MNIRKQIKALMWVAAAVLPLTFVVAQKTGADVQQRMAELAEIEALITDATQLRLIATETVLFREARSGIQWDKQLADMQTQLNRLPRRNEAEAAQLGRVAKSLQRAQSAYLRLGEQGAQSSPAAASAELPPAPGATSSSEAVGSLEARTVSSLLVITTEIMDVGHELSRQGRAEVSEAIRNSRVAVWVLMLTVLALLIALWRLVGRQVLAPLAEFQEGTKKIAGGDYGYRLNLPQQDEIGSLAEAFNAMTAQVQRSQQDLVEMNTHLISSHALALAAERDKQALLSTLNMHAIISVADRAGRIIEINDAFCRISGYSREELMGQNHRIVNSGAQPPAFWHKMWRTIAGAKPWQGEVCNRAKDGHLYWVDTVIAPFLGDDGEIEKYISIRTDISSHKLAELALLEAKTEAEAASRAKSDFLANMSHELRTPMNAILGMLTLLRKTELSARQSDYTVKTEGAARSLLGLLNEILDFSKVEADKMTLDPLPFEPEQLWRDLSVILASNLGAKKIDVLFDIDPDLPQTLIGDAMRLQQVLINLTGNAIKFTSEGSVLLSVQQVARSEGDITLRFAVKDTGIGIAPENHARIFSGFTQAEASTTRRFGGTGLGVAISQRLVALMGGSLQLDSALGQGSRFYFDLTLPVGSPLPHEMAGDTPHEGGESVPFVHVLLVEDRPLALEVLERQARSLGWHVDLVGSAKQALVLLEGAKAAGDVYHAVFVDWQMAEQSGQQLCERIRQSGLATGASLIALTNAPDREQWAQLPLTEQALVDGLLVKPISTAMLRDVYLEAHEGRGNRQAGGVAGMTVGRRLLGLRLLLVEDNLNNQQVARELLEDEGASVQIANNGQEALDAIKAATAQPAFDVVLMDLQMPVMDGLTAARIIRKDMGLSQLPVVAMTANAMASDREACLAAGMNDHVGKPFELNDLVRVLRRHAGIGEDVGAYAGAAIGDGAAAVAGANLALPDEVNAAAARAGVDISLALLRLGGKRAVYQRMLATVVRDLDSIADDLRAQLALADDLAASRLMHSLKGLSATIGHDALAAVAAQGERQLASSPAKAQAHEWVQRACNAIADAAPGLKALLLALQQASELERSAAPSGPTTLDALALRSALLDLSALLANADMAAMEAMSELQVRFGPVLTSKEGQSLYAGLGLLLARLDEAVGGLDFERALPLCQQMIEPLPVLPPA